jgi:predicted peptidase
MQTARYFKLKLSKTLELSYLIYSPKRTGKKKLPLVMFLHGGGECGTDLNLVKRHGLPKHIEAGQDFPFIVVAPQCPVGSWWTKEVAGLKGLLEHVIKTHDVDTKRVYLTGMSMGGMGTWQFAGMYPEYFAAIAPVCGGGELYAARALAKHKTPIWMFHGDKDTVVPLSETKRMMYWLKKFGGKAKLTVYKNIGHNSWEKAYQNPKLYEWLLSHKK